jgi:hypothetical protein
MPSPTPRKVYSVVLAAAGPLQDVGAVTIVRSLLVPCA